MWYKSSSGGESLFSKQASDVDNWRTKAAATAAAPGQPTPPGKKQRTKQKAAKKRRADKPARQAAAADAQPLPKPQRQPKPTDKDDATAAQGTPAHAAAPPSGTKQHIISVRGPHLVAPRLDDDPCSVCVAAMTRS